ncbi:hypothetical protein K7X08_037940 [Anisodus acutangulus]|uniref:Uncharacterized protein n=1 Tax=Anisodus acutangulus TaxID=402998 RepID=A0A9Q1N1U2_9SOLA|nr:hypothetical protein K7X08_037940 [Anisodus acutangulus]
MKMKLASGYKHGHDHDEDQIQDQDLGGMAKETCGHCDRGPSVIANRLTSIEDELVVITKLLEKKSRRRSKFISSSIRSSRKSIRKALKFVNSKKTKGNVNFYDIQSHPDHVDDAHDGPSTRLPDQIADASCKTLPLTDPAHVYNYDGPSSHLLDQVDDTSFKTLSSSHLPIQVDVASCKTLPDEVVDSDVNSEDKSPDGRITDVLAQTHGENDIEEFGDDAQNGYETANKEVFEQLFKLLFGTTI